MALLPLQSRGRRASTYPLPGLRSAGRELSCFAVKDVGKNKKDYKLKIEISRADTDHDDNVDVKTWAIE